MSAEKLSSPRGDPDLLLCGPWGRPKKKKVRYLLRPLGLKPVFMQTPRLSPDRGEPKGREKGRSPFERPGAKKNDHFLPNIFKVEYVPQALGRILVDY